MHVSERHGPKESRKQTALSFLRAYNIKANANISISTPSFIKRNNVCGLISLLKEFPLSQSVGYYFFTWPMPETGSSTTEFGYQVTSVAVKPTKYTFPKVPAHWRKGKLRILWLLVQCKQHRRGLSNVSFEKRTLNPSDSVHGRFCFLPISCTSTPKNHPQI